MLEVKTADFKLQYKYKNVSIEFDASKHHTRKNLDIIVQDINRVIEFLSDEQQKMLFDAIRHLHQTRMYDSLIDVILSLDDAIYQCIDKYGFKLKEEARTKLFFNQEEMNELLKVSLRCKLALPACIVQMNIETDILSKLATDIDPEIGSKLYKLIYNKLTPFKMSDTAMWNFLRMTMFGDIDVYAVMLLAFVQQRILISCEISKNPLVFILTVARDCMRWMSQSYGPFHDASKIETKPTFKMAQFLANIGKLKQMLLTWFKPEPLMTYIEQSKFVSPVQNIWCQLASKKLDLKKWDPTTAAIVSIYCAQALQNLNNSEIASHCVYLLTISKWIPDAKTTTIGHIDENAILSRTFKLYGVNVKHIVKSELVKLKQNYIYIDPLTGKKKLVNFKQLQKEFLTFCDLYLKGIVHQELDQVMRDVIC